MQNSRICAYIDKDAIKHNFNEIRKSLPENVKIMSVIKADGYGHGATLAAKLLCDKCDYFAVAIVEEAISLRKEGIKNPILLLGHTFPEKFEEAILGDVTLTIFTIDEARLLSETAQRLHKTAKIHIPVDTGMSRIGYLPTEEYADTIKEISNLPRIKVEGVFTHFSTADEEDKTFTKIQAERFMTFKQMLEKRNVEVEIYHSANSGAILQHKDFAFNMVRAGIILYGLCPSEFLSKNSLDLKSAMQLHSHVAFVKEIKKGESVSYGRTFTAENDMKIATIPVGYADGYPRMLSGKGRVIIKGKYAPIVGRVCMDQFMVDVSHIENVKIGDSVILMGSDSGLCVTADEIASLSQTINYEIVCGVSKRVPRMPLGSD